ncbi:MAG: LytTR family DNA-binding domain-containing protein [Agriterribacter sp.]
MIKVVIIEDEENSRVLLHNMLNQHFKNIEVLALCSNNEEAKLAINNLQPDLVLTDVELGNTSVFSLFEELSSINFDVIFITAFEKYAIRAIKFSALDYLLKPFSKEDLSEALNHYLQKQKRQQSFQQFETLFHNLRNMQNDSKKIALPTSKGLVVLPVKDIIRCQAEINYTTFFLSTKTKLLVTKTLKEYEELLHDYNFIRVHNSHLINLNHVKNYSRGEGGTVTMSDASIIEVSRRKKDEFLRRLASL